MPALQKLRYERAKQPPILHLLLLALLLLQTLPLAYAHGGADDSDSEHTNDAAPKPNLRATGLVVVKVCCLIIVFFATFIAGMSPYFFSWNHSFLVLGAQFVGGVFLGTAMMHFLSDANSTFGSLTDNGYPFAFMLACVGYLLTMLGDQHH